MAQKTELNTRQSDRAQHADLHPAIRFFDQHPNLEQSRVVVPANQIQQISTLSAKKVEAQIISRQCLDSAVLSEGNRSTHAKHFAQKRRPELVQPCASVGGIAATHTKQGGPPFGSNPNSGDSDFLHSLRLSANLAFPQWCHNLAHQLDLKSAQVWGLA